MKQINFDMDGTLVDLYHQKEWLNDILKNKTKPYREAKPLINMRTLSKELKRLQDRGYIITVITWLSKDSTPKYNLKVARTKIKWLQKHLNSIRFDEIHIIKYGTPKSLYGNGILFDDEQKNRDEWKGAAYNADNIINTLKTLS